MGRFCRCAFQPMSTGVFALVVVSKASEWRPQLFSEVPCIFREREVNPCKRLWKRLFWRHRQCTSQNGIVGAMEFGKVPPLHYFRAEAMPIKRGMG